MEAQKLSQALVTLLDDYAPGAFYDEMFTANGGAAASLRARSTTSSRRWRRRNSTSAGAWPISAFLLQGITFTVYNDGLGTERLFPFDLVPRILPRAEWDRIERGLSQRVIALNLFLQDVYGPQRILKDRIVPAFAGPVVPPLPARDDRRQRAARHLHAYRRHRPGPRFRAPASSWCSRTTSARRAASPTCSRTVWS